MTKKILLVIVLLVIVGLALESRSSYYTMEPVSIKAEEISEEVPEILLSLDDQAMEERLLTDSDFRANISSAPDDGQTFSIYPLSDATVLLNEWLKDDWELKELAYNGQTVTISVTMSESQNLIYLFSTNGSFDSQKTIGVYDDGEPYRNCITIYSNNGGTVEKQVRTRVWFYRIRQQLGLL